MSNNIEQFKLWAYTKELYMIHLLCLYNVLDGKTHKVNATALNRKCYPDGTFNYLNQNH